MQEREYDGSYILVFNIPRADRSQIPVYLNGNPDNTYKRNHEGDYKCTPDEVRRMFADADIEHPRDSKILQEFSIETDIDTESLNQYRRMVSAIKPSHPWLRLDNKEMLTKLGGYRIDKRNKTEGLTLAGLLMFGKTESITDPYCCPSYFPDYREYLSFDPKDRWTDRIYPDGIWEANLFQFYTKVFPKLSMALPKPFTLKNGIRIEETPTHVALREAFINTLVHCDYAVNSNITIELRRDKYMFSNPGTLLISIPQYYRGGDSVCRNKSLQQMFMYLGAAEKAGSGVDKILQGWKVANFRSPQIEEKTKSDKVILVLPLVSLLSDEVIDRLKELFGEGIVSIDHNKLLTLATCCSEGEVTNNRLQLVIDKHRSDITKLLKELCVDGYLISEGAGRGTKYKLNTDYFDNTAADSDTSNHVSNHASKNTFNQPSKRTQLSASELQKQILEICAEYLTVVEISVKVNKSIPHLKNAIIPQLVNSGLLEREFPDTPRHPKQRYRRKE